VTLSSKSAARNGQQPFASHARMSLRKGLEKRRQYRLASNVSFQQILRRSEQRVAGFGNPKPPSCSPAANPTSASGAEQTHRSISWSMLNAEPSLVRPYGARELPSAGKKPGHQKLSHRMIQPFSFSGICALPERACCDCLVTAAHCSGPCYRSHTRRLSGTTG
jgi:hypothetical protein